MLTVEIVEEDIGGHNRSLNSIELPSDIISPRELIRSQVFQQAKDDESKGRVLRRSLFVPSDIELLLNGSNERNPEALSNWTSHFARIIHLFEAGQILIFIDQKQVEKLDEELHIDSNTKILFVNIVPLAGG